MMPFCCFWNSSSVAGCKLLQKVQSLTGHLKYANSIPEGSISNFQSNAVWTKPIGSILRYFGISSLFLSSVHHILRNTFGNSFGCQPVTSQGSITSPTLKLLRG